MRALRAPGSAGELGDEERYVAMFREARGLRRSPRPPSSPRAAGSPAGTAPGSALAVALAVGGGGVAAAYTGNLPDPIQEFAHRALGPVGPPAPDKSRPHRAKDLASKALTTPSATPTPPATPTGPPVTVAVAPRRPARRRPRRSRPRRPPRPPSSHACTDALDDPDPHPNNDGEPHPPTATPTVVPPPVVAEVSIAGSTHRVEPGQSVAVSRRGQVRGWQHAAPHACHPAGARGGPLVPGRLRAAPTPPARSRWCFPPVDREHRRTPPLRRRAQRPLADHHAPRRSRSPRSPAPTTARS